MYHCYYLWTGLSASQFICLLAGGGFGIYYLLYTILLENTILENTILENTICYSSLSDLLPHCSYYVFIIIIIIIIIIIY